MTGTRIRFAAIVAFVFGVAMVAGFASIGAASHGSQANFTVYPQENGDRSPEATAGTYVMSSAGADAFEADRGLEAVDYYWLESDQADFSACDPDNARVFGIDRGNNNTGTQVDDGLLEHMKSHSVQRHRITLDLFTEEDLGGDSIHLYAPDATIAVLGDCVENTGEPGWYQFTGFVNGTTFAGNYEEVRLTSHYFWIGDFEDEEAAREELGPPPSEADEGGDRPASTPTPTPTPTPTATATVTPEEGGADASASTPTATSTASGTSDGSGGDGGDGDGSSGDDAGTTGDDSGEHVPAGDGSSGLVATPTPGSGPGFGPVAALIALLGSGLLAGRLR